MAVPLQVFPQDGLVCVPAMATGGGAVRVKATTVSHPAAFVTVTVWGPAQRPVALAVPWPPAGAGAHRKVRPVSVPVSVAVPSHAPAQFTGAVARLTWIEGGCVKVKLNVLLQPPLDTCTL